jgi:hypothetical protein
MPEFDLIAYYKSQQCIGLTDEQIAKTLGMTVDDLFTALNEQGYGKVTHLPKKFTILTYKNGKAEYDPWFSRYVTDSRTPMMWYRDMSYADDTGAKLALEAELDKLFYTTFTFEDNRILKDSQVNPVAYDCNFGVHLDTTGNDNVILFTILADVFPDSVDSGPVISFSISLDTDSETGDTTLVLGDNIAVEQEAIDAANIQSIEVSMMSLYYD